MISVVVPLFNKGETVGATLASVQSQSETAWELVVVDDGSRDDGPAVVTALAESDDRIRLVRQPNAGVSAARNTGAKEARGDVVAFLDADDTWSPEHLANLLALRRRFPQAVAWAAAYKVVDDLGRERAVRMRPADGDDAYLITDYFDDAVSFELPVHSSAVMVDRAVLWRIGGFPVGVKSGEDILTWSRLSCEGAIAFSRRVTAMYFAPSVRAEARPAVVRRPAAVDMVRQGLQTLRAAHPARARSVDRFLGLWLRIRATSFLELREPRASLIELVRAVTVSGLRGRDIASVLMLCLPAFLRERLLAWVRSRGEARAG